MEPKVIYKDENFLVINKPAGMLVHKIANSKWQIANGTMVDWLLENFPEVKNVGDAPEERPGIVHRLDRDTSGVLIVARNQPTFEYFKKEFQAHRIKKTYLALVYGEPREKTGVINHPIGILNGSVKRTIHVERARMIKEAITRYKVLKTFMLSPACPSKLGERSGELVEGQSIVHVSLLEVEPQTGRTHQIRVHLASIGHPIVGDKLYGPKNPKIKIDRQFLHADSIEFTSPDGKRLKISADLQEELQKIIL